MEVEVFEETSSASFGAVLEKFADNDKALGEDEGHLCPSWVLLSLLTENTGTQVFSHGASEPP